MFVLLNSLSQQGRPHSCPKESPRSPSHLHQGRAGPAALKGQGGALSLQDWKCMILCVCTSSPRPGLILSLQQRVSKNARMAGCFQTLRQDSPALAEMNAEGQSLPRSPMVTLVSRSWNSHGICGHLHACGCDVLVKLLCLSRSGTPHLPTLLRGALLPASVTLGQFWVPGLQRKPRAAQGATLFT